jgi:hypothetical protein
VAVVAHLRGRLEKEGCARRDGVAHLLAIRVEAGNHVSRASQQQVDFLLLRMLVRNVGPARSEVHQEQAVHHVCRGELVAPAGGQAHQQLEMRGRAMLAKHLERHIAGIRHQQFRRGQHVHALGNAISHHHHFEGRVRRVGDSVFHSHRQVQEIAGLQRSLLVAVPQASAARGYEIELFLGGIGDGRGGPARLHGEFAIPGHTLQPVRIRVADAEQGPVEGRHGAVRRQVVGARPDIRQLPP